MGGGEKKGVPKGKMRVGDHSKPGCREEKRVKAALIEGGGESNKPFFQKERRDPTPKNQRNTGSASCLRGRPNLKETPGQRSGGKGGKKVRL